MPQSPLFKSYRIEGNTIRIGFDNPGKGFMKPDTIKGFIIAGADHIFYPATVTIRKRNNSRITRCSPSGSCQIQLG